MSIVSTTAESEQPPVKEETTRETSKVPGNEYIVDGLASVEVSPFPKYHW